jgi:hypothetical protein
MFSVGPPRDYISSPVVNQKSDLFGGGVEYLHRRPASHRRRRKGNPVPGGISGILGDINTGTWPSRLGSLESEKVKCDHESRGTRT